MKTRDSDVTLNVSNHSLCNFYHLFLLFVYLVQTVHNLLDLLSFNIFLIDFILIQVFLINSTLKTYSFFLLLFSRL